MIPTLLALAFCAPAQAGVTLSLSDARPTPGGTATVDVLISSDAADMLDLFGLAVRISPVSGDREVVFVPSPNTLGVDDTDGHFLDPNYLFYNDSANRVYNDPTSPDYLPTSLVSGSEYIGGDGTYYGTGVTVSTTPTLLTRLRVAATDGLALQSGDTFTILIDQDPASTFFIDPDFNPLQLTVTTNGTITVGISAVPEPPQTVLIASMGLVLAGFAWMRGRRLRRPVDEVAACRSVV